MQVKRAEIFSGLWFKNDYDYNADRMFHEQRTTKIVQIFLVSNNETNEYKKHPARINTNT